MKKCENLADVKHVLPLGMLSEFSPNFFVRPALHTGRSDNRHVSRVCVRPGASESGSASVHRWLLLARSLSTGLPNTLPERSLSDVYMRHLDVHI